MSYRYRVAHQEGGVVARLALAATVVTILIGAVSLAGTDAIALATDSSTTTTTAATTTTTSGSTDTSFATTTTTTQAPTTTTTRATTTTTQATTTTTRPPTTTTTKPTTTTATTVAPPTTATTRPPTTTTSSSTTTTTVPAPTTTLPPDQDPDLIELSGIGSVPPSGDDPQFTSRLSGAVSALELVLPASAATVVVSPLLILEALLRALFQAGMAVTVPSAIAGLLLGLIMVTARRSRVVTA